MHFTSTRGYTYKCSSVKSTIELLFDNTDMSFHPFYIIETTLSKNHILNRLQKALRTNAELIKVHSDKCRTYKSPLGQMQKRQMQNLQKAIRTNAVISKKRFGQKTTHQFGETTTQPFGLT